MLIWKFTRLSIPPYTWVTEVIVCTVRVELHWLHHIEFFSFFPFFSPPGRLSPIISTLHVCKAWAPWGILCPLHPLLCWGLCSSWHLAPPVQPLCRCLYSQLPCPCPWPLLQPVCQPALYSRYNLRPVRPHRKIKNPITLTLLSWFTSVFTVNHFKFKASTSYIANPALPSGFVALLLCTQEHIQQGTVCPSLTATSLSPLSPGFSPALNPCSSLRLTRGLQVLPASWQLGPKGLRGGGGVGRGRGRDIRLMPGPALDPYLLVLCAPFTQPGPILSLLITGLNVERRTERALDANVSFKAAYYVDIIMPLQLLSLIRSI